MKRFFHCIASLVLVFHVTPSLPNVSAAHAQSGGSSGQAEPCPPIEWLCDDPTPGGDWGEGPNCTCGPGKWIRTDRRPMIDPPAPQRSVTATSENWVNWRTLCTREATDGTAQITVELAGASTFWHAGSKARTESAQFSGGWRETWRGAFPPCPRMLLLAASGNGTLAITASCAARLGCTASAACSAAGVAMSRGNASASIEGQSLQGTVGYNALDHTSEISGNFGGSLDFWTGELEGSISRELRWKTKGQGSAAGTLSFTVLPDRTYCALTNLPVMASWTASLAATLTASVDENGTAAAATGAAISLKIH